MVFRLAYYLSPSPLIINTIFFVMTHYILSKKRVNASIHSMYMCQQTCSIKHESSFQKISTLKGNCT